MSYTRILLRRGTSTEWSTANPILANGEFGFESNTGKFKIGNGSSNWSALEYFANANSIKGDLIDNAPSALNTLNELAAALDDNANFATTITNLINAKAPLASPTFTGTVDFSAATVSGIILPINWMGTYDVGTTYAENDMVHYDGSVYYATGENINGASYYPTAVGADWELFASKGETGATGATGPAGPAGETPDVSNKKDIEVLAKNTSGFTILKGTSVSVTGADGSIPTISSATGYPDGSRAILGLVKADIANGSTGLVVTEGIIENLNTSGAAAVGSKAYMGRYGGLVFDDGYEGEGPGLEDVLLGVVVVKDATVGKIYVKIENRARQSLIQEQIDAKLTTPSQTGNNGKFLTTDGSNPSWATIDLSSKQDVVSGVSSTEIGYLDGVTSAIQTQLDGKASTSHTHTFSSLTDFNISSPTNGQTLTYNSSTGKWVNAAAAATGETISSFLLMGA